MPTTLFIMEIPCRTCLRTIHAPAFTSSTPKNKCIPLEVKIHHYAGGSSSTWLHRVANASEHPELSQMLIQEWDESLLAVLSSTLYSLYNPFSCASFYVICVKWKYTLTEWTFRREQNDNKRSLHCAQSSEKWSILSRLPSGNHLIIANLEEQVIGLINTFHALAGQPI